jgi:hypothetical protein
MANRRLDALAAAALDQNGEQVSVNHSKDAARELVRSAAAALPGGLPEASPYRKFARDALLAEAARLDMRLAPLMTEEELPLVLEHMRQQIVAGAKPSPVPAQPPVPMQPAPPVKIRGLKPSESGRWVVRTNPTDKPKNVSIGGQMTTLRTGKVIDAAYYGPGQIQSIVDQGVKLVPVEDVKDED